MIAVFNARFALSSGRSIVGEKLTHDAPGYKKIKWLASRQGLVAASLVELIFIANLVYAIHLILDQGDRGYATGMLILGPLVIIVACIGVLRGMANNK